MSIVAVMQSGCVQDTGIIMGRFFSSEKLTSFIKPVQTNHSFKEYVNFFVKLEPNNTV